MMNEMKAGGGGPVLLDVNQVAALLGVSRSHVFRMTDSGQMPRPLRLGSLVKWRRADLDDWLAAGAPRVSRPGAGARG